MINEYLTYFRDNPQGYWFKVKLYGWGWTPVKWQGWFVVLVYIAFITILIISKEDPISRDPDSGSNFLIFGLPIILLTALLIFICYKKGEKLHWQWGPPKK
jgi:hypothetical protein